MTALLDGATRGRLESWLAAAAGKGDAMILDARPLKGGAIQENWLLDVSFDGGATEAYVLRSDAPALVAASLSRAQEFSLLQVAQRAGVMVPAPLWLCEDREVLGRPFYLMRRLGGTASGHRIVKDTALGGDKAQLAERLGQELAKLHRVTPKSELARSLTFLRRPQQPPVAEAVALYRRYLDDLGSAHPVIEWGLRWAEKHAPEHQDVTLIHQDFRTGNYMVDEKGLTGILDWEFAAWGDPMSDLGWFTAKCWRFGQTAKEAGGLARRADFYRGYENESGRPVDGEAVAFWEVVAHLRWAIIALQQGLRHLSGQQRSLELALTGRMAAELEYVVLQLTAPDQWRRT